MTIKIKSQSGMLKNRERIARGILTLEEIRSLKIAGVGPAVLFVWGIPDSSLPNLAFFSIEVQEVLS